MPGEILHIDIKKLAKIDGVGHRMHGDRRQAERFIRTSLEEWAYAQPYEHSSQRSYMLKHFLDFYNNHRHHHGINATPARRCEQRLGR